MTPGSVKVRRRKVECACFCICVGQVWRFLNKGSWSHSCCIPTYSRHWTGPPQRPGLFDQLCAGLPIFHPWWRSALTCWTLPPGCFWVENSVLCSSAGCSQCRCDWGPLGIPPDGSWMDLQRPLMQHNEQMDHYEHLIILIHPLLLLFGVIHVVLEWMNE